MPDGLNALMADGVAGTPAMASLSRDADAYEAALRLDADINLGHRPYRRYACFLAVGHFPGAVDRRAASFLLTAFAFAAFSFGALPPWYERHNR